MGQIIWATLIWHIYCINYVYEIPIVTLRKDRWGTVPRTSQSGLGKSRFDKDGSISAEGRGGRESDPEETYRKSRNETYDVARR